MALRKLALVSEFLKKDGYIWCIYRHYMVLLILQEEKRATLPKYAQYVAKAFMKSQPGPPNAMGMSECKVFISFFCKMTIFFSLWNYWN